MALGLLLVAPVFFAQTVLAQTVADPDVAPDAASTAPHHNAHKAATPAVVLPPMPSGPLSQLPMDQIPATPAKVTFQGGLLEITAQNSTLGEILRNVRKLTGASIDIPQGSSAANERVVTHLGPGAPRDVLAVLLNGSSFNYVMVGSSTDPTAVSSILLSVKPSATGETKTASNVSQNTPQPMPPGLVYRPFNGQFPQPGGGPPMNGQTGNAQPGNAEADEPLEDDQDAADTTTDDQTQPGQADAAEPNTQVQPLQQPDPNQPNAGPRTPEQILEMLRRQQQPGGAPVPPVPAPQTPPQQ